MVEKFTEWLKDNTYKFRDLGFCDPGITYLSSEKGGSGAVIASMDNGRYFCDINVRNDEIVNIEAISSNENDTPFIMYGQVNKYVDFDNYMGSFFEFFGCGASGDNLGDWLSENSGKFKKRGFSTVTEENSGDGKFRSVFKTEKGKYICSFSVRTDNCVCIEIEERCADVPLPFWIHLMAGDGVAFDKLMCNFFDFFKGDVLNMNKENLENDWRLNGQEDYLMNARLTRKIYRGEGHEHCVFCWHKFMENADNVGDCSGEGYCTEDGRHWICGECFRDFGESFKWEII